MNVYVLVTKADLILEPRDSIYNIERGAKYLSQHSKDKGCEFPYLDMWVFNLFTIASKTTDKTFQKSTKTFTCR